jgi:hypothetical protein
MLSQLSIWVLAATLGQAPNDAAWLKAVPADVDAAFRTRGLQATRDDLAAMLKAMSPALADQAIPALTAQLDQFKERMGEPATRTPWVSVIKMGADAASTAYAVLVLEGEYQDVLTSINKGKAPELKHEDGGYDSFPAPDGNGTWYAAKGTGFVAFGPDKGLIAAVAKPGEKTLDSVLSPALKKPLLAGDAGLYVNAAALVTRYGDQIEAGRQAFMATLDQAGQQMGNATTIEAAKSIYGGLFDALKYADRLTLDLDFSAEALDLAGVLAVKADSELAKGIAASHPGTAASLGKFSPNAAFYAYMNLNATAMGRLQGMALNLFNPGGKKSPEQEKATAQLEALGRIETVGATTMGEGMKALNEITVSDPKAYIAATLAMLKAIKGSEGPLNVYKEVKVEENVQTHQGLSFTHVTATFDPEKLAKLAGNNPAGAGSMKAMFGGDSISYWFGTDGKRLIQVTTASWDEAKKLIDAFLKGDAGVGTKPGFKAVRSRLPETANFLMLVSAQGLTKMIATQLVTTLNKPDLKVPANLPAEPAFFGLSLTPVPPAAYEFHLVVPSPVGPVIEKGLVPIFRGIQGGN